MAERKLSAVIQIGGAVSSSLGKAFAAVTRGTKDIGKELKAVTLQTKELEKMVKELKAAGKSTADLEKRLQALYRRQGTLRGQQGRLGSVGHMIGGGGGGLQFGATTSLILRKMVESEAFGKGTVAALLGAEAALPVIGEIAMAVTVLVGAAVAGAAAIFSLGKSAADFIDGTSDMADSLGVATNNLLGLRFAAAQSGIEAEKLDEKIAKMTMSLESAKDGTGPAADALKELGLSYRELSVMNPEEQILALAQAFKEYNGTVPKVTLSNAFFGKGGARFVNLLNQGRDGIRAMMQDARSVGYTISKEQEDMATRFDAAWNTTLIGFKAAWLQIGSSVLPTINAMLEQVVAWFKDPKNQQVIKDMAADLGGLLKEMATALPPVVAGMNAIASAIANIVRGTRILFAIGGWKMFSGNPGLMAQGISEKAGAGIGDLLASPVGRTMLTPTGMVTMGSAMVSAAAKSPPTPAVVSGAQHQSQPAPSGSVPPLIAKPGAPGGNTYNFTINGATRENTRDLMEEVRRYLRDTEPQHVGGF